MPAPNAPDIEGEPKTPDLDKDRTSKPRKDELLDEGLEDTFPASDPMPAPSFT